MGGSNRKLDSIEIVQKESVSISMKTAARNWKPIWALFFFLVLSALSLGLRLGGEWKGDHDGFGGALFSVVARNYLRYGFLGTKWGLATNGGWFEPWEFRYQTSHTPFLPLLITASFKLFGISEPAARLIPLLFAVSFVIVFYLFALRFFNEEVAFLASLFLTLSPVLMTFGNRTNYEIGALFFMTLFFYSYFSWLRSPRRKHYLLMLLSFSLAGIMSWSGYFSILPVLIHPLLARAWRRKPLPLATGSLTLSLVLLGVGIFGFHLFHVYSLGGIEELFHLAHHFFWRAGGIPIREALPGVGWMEFFSLESYRAFYLFTPIVLFFSIGWGVCFVKTGRRGSFSETDEIIFLLLILGLAPIFVFRNVCYHHNFFLLYLLPFTSLSAGSKLRLRSRIRWAALVGFIGCSAFTVLLLNRWDADLVLVKTRDEERPKDIGQWLAGNTVLNDRILSNIGWWPQIDYYSDRNIVHYVDRREERLQKFSQRGKPYPYFLLYMKAPFQPGLIEDFKKHYVLKAKYSDDFFLYRYELG